MKICDWVEIRGWVKTMVQMILKPSSGPERGSVAEWKLQVDGDIFTSVRLHYLNRAKRWVGLNQPATALSPTAIRAHPMPSAIINTRRLSNKQNQANKSGLILCHWHSSTCQLSRYVNKVLWLPKNQRPFAYFLLEVDLSDRSKYQILWLATVAL